MRIIRSKSFLENHVQHTRPELNGTALVIDAHNFLYVKYKDSNLNNLFGCECDKYANFLREELSVFRKAKVKCYFIFKGGNKDNKKLLKLEPIDGNLFLTDRYFSQPLLAREVNKQVLDEMGFDYAICEYVSKDECVALAQKLNCPVVSFDIEYFFYGIQYIPFPSLNFDQCSNILTCQLYKLDDLIERYQIEIEQIAILLTIIDENIFPREFIENLLKKLRIPLSYTKRYEALLQWLSNNRLEALNIISLILSQEECVKFKCEMRKFYENLIKVLKPVGLASKFLVNKDLCKIKKCDPEWFAKGVIWNFISITYINIYRWRIVEGSWSAEDYNAEDSLLLSAPVIRYAFDLLTNFKDEKIIYMGRRYRKMERADGVLKVDSDLEILPSVRKPNYGDNNVFESGWDNILDHKLFEHFLEETLQMSDLNKLEKVPRNAALLFISCLYCSHQKQTDFECEVYAVLLSYVVLGVLTDETISEETLTKKDRLTAVNLMDEYFHVPRAKLTEVYDTQIIHPLVQFQHCLRHINFLNTLCGSPFAPTVYSKTFNATFVYNIVRDMKKGEGSVLLDDKLKNVPTVRSYINNLINLYNEIK